MVDRRQALPRVMTHTTMFILVFAIPVPMKLKECVGGTCVHPPILFIIIIIAPRLDPQGSHKFF